MVQDNKFHNPLPVLPEWEIWCKCESDIARLHLYEGILCQLEPKSVYLTGECLSVAVLVSKPDHYQRKISNREPRDQVFLVGRNKEVRIEFMHNFYLSMRKDLKSGLI
jgi:hypothetical protein